VIPCRECHRPPSSRMVQTPETLTRIVEEGSPTRWKATGYVEGVGWLEAWGTSLVAAMEALQALAAQRVAEEKDGMR
jgi:hypothetical protein